MKLPVTVTLSEFSFEALARGEEPDSERVQGRFVRAIRFYLSEADARRPGWSVPTALREEQPTGIEIELALDEDLLDALEAEAGRQDVTLSRLVSQTVIYYAAELDAGRIAQRIIEDLDAEA